MVWADSIGGPTHAGGESLYQKGNTVYPVSRRLRDG